jgi:ABC-type antimicrobial peptide transport system permease subunit
LAGWFIRGLLYAVSPWDPLVYASAVPVLMLAGLIACLLPARRAVRTNPVDALRAE